MATDIIPIKKCSVCGKKFAVPHPGLWVYKSKNNYPKYQCSYKCYSKTFKSASKTIKRHLYEL